MSFSPKAQRPWNRAQTAGGNRKNDGKGSCAQRNGARFLLTFTKRSAFDAVHSDLLLSIEPDNEILPSRVGTLAPLAP